MTINLVHFIRTDLLSVTESYFLSGIHLDFAVQMHSTRCRRCLRRAVTLASRRQDSLRVTILKISDYLLDSTRTKGAQLAVRPY
ncbi:hypothetical protein [Nostoc sp.]|uniref:hypothetical protein n=1 Tax=Nostoc sp. TaxID=1180 RepID=UPI002FEEA52E